MRHYNFILKEGLGCENGSILVRIKSMDDFEEQVDNNEKDPRSRRQARPRKPVGQPGFLFPTFLTAVIFATIFVSITPDVLNLKLTDQFRSLFSAEQGMLVINRDMNADITVGIVAGHMGLDPGAVCDNGTKEADVNLKIATLLQQKLGNLGYKTDLLQEKDPRLQGYKASLLISIHNDSCKFVNDQATGFKVARAIGTVDENLSARLLACMRNRYQQTTQLPWHDSVTRDMTEYHAFDEIDPSTPAAIIETGFLYLDYDILTKDTDKVADGITNGITCFLQNETIEPVATTVSEQ